MLNERFNVQKNILLIGWLLPALLIWSCTNKKEVSKVTISFGGFKQPVTSFDLDFDYSTLRINNFGYRPVLDFPSQRLAVEFSRVYRLPTKNASQLKALFNNHRPDSTTILENNDAMDGSGFTIYYIRPNTDTVQLQVAKPKREKYYESAYKQIDSFFAVAYQAVDDSSGIASLDDSYNVYYPRLPVRKVSSDPPVYRIWGTVNGCRADQPELISFLESIKNEECAIVEIRSQKLSYCIAEVFAQYSLRGNIHFISADLERNWDIMQAKKQEKAGLATVEEARFYKQWLAIPKAALFKSKAAIIQEYRQLKQK